MPNWCISSYAFTSEDKELLKEFHAKICRYTSSPRVKNGFGDNWLGNVVDGFALDWNKLPCRGSIDYLDDGLSKNGDEWFFRLDDTTAWAPVSEMWDSILEKDYANKDGYPVIHYVYIAEEPGCNLYVNTDESGDYFSERYLVDDGDDIREYFKTEEDCRLFIVESLKLDAHTSYKDALIEAHKAEMYVHEFENK